MRSHLALAFLVFPLALAACGSNEQGESADDFAARLDGASAAEAGAANDGAGQPVNPQLANLPKVAANGQQAVRFDSDYVNTAADGSTSGLSIYQNGTFRLVENGQLTEGRYEWLPDGKRLRLNGVGFRPIVLVADGALYRMTNENVPLNDVTPDRMYSLAGSASSAE